MGRHLRRLDEHLRFVGARAYDRFGGRALAAAAPPLVIASPTKNLAELTKELDDLLADSGDGGTGQAGLEAWRPLSFGTGRWRLVKADHGLATVSPQVAHVGAEDGCTLCSAKAATVAPKRLFDNGDRE